MSFRAATRGCASALVTWIALAFPCSPVMAVDSDSGSAAPTIIVTATRSEANLTQVPESVTVVGTAEIQQTPANSLDDVLRHVPGVNLPIQTGAQAHPTADNVSMRGLGGIHALVMVDGVPLNDPFFGYIQWGRIPLESIDRVEIVRGGREPPLGQLRHGRSHQHHYAFSPGRCCHCRCRWWWLRHLSFEPVQLLWIVSNESRERDCGAQWNGRFHVRAHLREAAV